jgi:aryl-alcohol dehydrogenase-like predicted oxidoreductase
MQYRTLGKTNLQVSEISFGAWAVGGPAKMGTLQTGWGETSDDQSAEAIKAALDAGVNFFDTADVYGNGHSEELLGKAVEGMRDKVIIASKVGNRTTDGKWTKDFSPQWINQSVDGSLRRLRTDYLDVYFMHTPRTDEQFQACMDAQDCLDRLKEAGKIRHYGISIGPVADGVKMIQAEFGEVIQVVYNILEREPEAELFPLAIERKIGIVARVPLASGFLSGKYTSESRFPDTDHRSQLMTPESIRETVASVDRLKDTAVCKTKPLVQTALQFVLAHPAVSTTIPGGKTKDQVRENALASDGVLLGEEELAQIRAAIPSTASGKTDQRLVDQFRGK